MLDGVAKVDVIDRQSISDQVYLHVKALILSGALKSGERIPENKVAEHFNVSRTPVREAIRKLADYGLVVIKPWSFAFVTTISAKEAKDISMVRLWLERLAFRLFAAKADREALAPLYELARKCKAANEAHDNATVYEYDSQLHLSIAEGTGNLDLVRILHTLDAKLQLLRLKQHLPAEQLAVYLDQHETLLRLIESGDSEKFDALLERHIIHDLGSE